MAKHGAGAPVIIKKVKKGGHGGHHGGAWKVAYADFVTAMMAFFLLMWLLGATTEDKRKGIADFFSGMAASKTQSGAGGVLGGTSIAVPGPLASASSPMVIIQTPREAPRIPMTVVVSSSSSPKRAGRWYVISCLRTTHAPPCAIVHVRPKPSTSACITATSSAYARYTELLTWPLLSSS